ncbi:cytochrome oxidase subunit II-like protein [Dinothrombium tinctorium]|uniref:Cytochrome oxidase subunit II-like protein n=1 Tax=Dinothrombium tinctorium TaxID=1965070 RepID=A0A3S4QP71_9ACAR|nr:cytochrome oxidase subunit II-like protein [Dinothrombium tinctorium]
MILKIRIFRLYKTRIRFIYNTRATDRHISAIRYRQPNCPTDRRTALMNSTKPRSKNRCYPRATKPSQILNQPTWCLIRTMLRNLWSKSQIYTDYN